MECTITMKEAGDYVSAYGIEGVALTEPGAMAAISILGTRRGWTPAHGAMLARLEAGERTLPLKLGRLVSGTRIGLAIELARKVNRKHLRNQKNAARRKAAKARHGKKAAA